MKRILTIFFLVLLCSGFSAFSQCMSGTYTIGPFITDDYPTFNGAVSDLISNGVCGPVTILVKEETYVEQIAIPNIIGASNVNRITFKSDPANLNKPLIDISPLSADPYLLLLDSASYITFDGFWLNYHDPGVGFSVTSATVLFRNSAAHNTITNCILYASNISTQSLVLGQEWYPTASAFSDNELSNSNILLGDVSFRGDGINSSDSRIKNNYFAESSGIQMAAMNSFEISNNTFQNVNTTYSTPAILINGCDSAAIIAGNKLIGEWILGIRVKFGYVNSTLLISNNFISCGGVGTNNNIEGINLFNVNSAKVYNNSVGIYSTILQRFDAALYMQNSTNVDVKNNIFSNFAGNTVMYITQGLQTFTSNNNDLYTTGDTLLTMDGIKYLDLASWQANFRSRDTNSYSIDPLFTDTNDLHVNQIVLRNKAVSFPEVRNDIDQEPRNAKPDIGADEFAALTDSVWPGDSNNDGIADAGDLIPLGIYYGSTGPSRAIVSNTWQKYYSLPWNNQIANFNDAKFADCNGDGIVNLDDTLALTINAGLSHPLRLALNINTTKKHAYIHFQNDTINSGSFANINFDFDINVGTTDSIYSFQLASLLNPINVVLNTLYTDKAIPTWGSYASNYIAISTLNSNSNKYIIAATVIDHQNKVVNQNLLHFGFKILNQTGQGFWYKLPVEKFIVYDNKGATLDYSLISDSVFVTIVTGINENSLHASELYFRNNDKIILNEPIDQLRIFDLAGRLVFKRNYLKANDVIVLPLSNSNMIILQFAKGSKLLQEKIFNTAEK